VALRSILGCLLPVVLVLTACKGKDKDADETSGTAALDLEKRCAQLAKLCSDSDKHVQKLIDECKRAAPLPGCVDKLFAAYDCYEKELCGKHEQVWALDDLRVLTERHKACVAERQAAASCK
jgi:hypothetical protein